MTPEEIRERKIAESARRARERDAEVRARIVRAPAEEPASPAHGYAREAPVYDPFSPADPPPTPLPPIPGSDRWWPKAPEPERLAVQPPAGCISPGEAAALLHLSDDDLATAIFGRVLRSGIVNSKIWLDRNYIQSIAGNPIALGELNRWIGDVRMGATKAAPFDPMMATTAAK